MNPGQTGMVLWILVPLLALALLWVRADVRDSNEQLIRARDAYQTLDNRHRALTIERGRLTYSAEIRRIAVEELSMVNPMPERTVLVQLGVDP